ncbi:excisionase family DNA-binding protein [Kocuria rosea]|uniref:excisionase family DNA-binding protein n=1 Tax=Kocuria rosea TaxID=1275 RepID=UPI000E00439E|nr:excisionase family DNA-binding protein [Kocuria rosea]STX05733.1 DNA binding domain, excisionase family [Kocuria rosea]
MATLLRTSSEQVLASPEQVDQARRFMNTLTDDDARVSIESHGDATTMPPELSRIISHILRVLAEGGTVTVGSLPDELTTTSAAQLLGISRPTLMKMIKRGEIKAHKVGSHSRLSTDEVIAARRARRERQRRALDELRTLEDELGI